MGKGGEARGGRPMTAARAQGCGVASFFQGGQFSWGLKIRPNKNGKLIVLGLFLE